MSKLLLRLLREGKITAEEYEAETGEKAPTFTVEEVGDGTAVAQHHSTAVASRGVVANDAQIIITGDNTYINGLLPLAQQSRDDLTSEQFETEIRKYLNWVVAQNRTISMRGVQHGGRNVIDLDLDTVYVPLAAQPTRDPDKSDGIPDRAETNRPQQIELDAVLGQGKRLIITGGPGCGKTTVLMHLAWVLAEAFNAGEADLATEKLGITDPIPLPILLPVNRYAKHLRDAKSADVRQETLAAFISNYLIKRSASLDLPHTFFHNLLKQGKDVLLLLDGLDEVPNEEERATVSQAIEDLVAGHPDLRVAVTCRTAAYNGRVALAQSFREIKVLPLADEHIKRLIENAYKAVEPTSEHKQQVRTQDLLDGIAHMERERKSRLGDRAERLVTSPLLIRMLLLVHLSERQLPQQRAELYAKAVDNLIISGYGLDADVQNELGRLVGDKAQHLELMQFIAFHMHEQGEAQGREIDEFDLRRLLKREPRFAPLIPAFIQATRERGGLMEERLASYRFVHLAFQEFLVARYMVEELLFEQKLFDYLADTPIITDSWWREPLLLLGGYLSNTSPKRAASYLYFLAGLEGSTIGNQAAEKQWMAIELAGTVVHEWPTVSDLLKEAITERQVTLIEQTGGESISPPVRASVGVILGQLGDPRDGVGVKNGLPDIVWGKEVPVGDYWIGGDDEAYKSFERQKIPITQPYQLARYSVTYAQFQAFIDDKGLENDEWWDGIADGHRRNYRQSWPIANHPRENVTWYGAVAFCRWLTAQIDDQYVIRLPHEYEWEVAARFNDGRFYPWGRDFNENKANTEENGLNRTVAVGLYVDGRQPNLNLYDMSGNVWEWCQNKHDNPKDMVVDDSNGVRVLRGGSWSDDQFDARAASRSWYLPNNRLYLIGFRLCRVLRPPSLL